jgi:hypothetical protein
MRLAKQSSLVFCHYENTGIFANVNRAWQCDAVNFSPVACTIKVLQSNVTIIKYASV